MTQPATQEAVAASWHPLRDVLARVDALLAGAVEAMRAASVPAAAEPFRGLVVSDADVARLVARGLEPLGATLATDRPIVDVEAAGLPWVHLAATFGLTPPEVDVLALALASEIDLRYERIFGYLHDDVSKRRPTPELVIQLLCQSFEEGLAARRLLGPQAPLRRYDLVHLASDPAQPAAPEIAHALRLDPGILEFLLGHPPFDARLGDAVAVERALDDEAMDAGEERAGESAAVVERVVAELGRLHAEGGMGAPRTFVLSGPDHDAKLRLLRAVARRLAVPLVLADLEKLSRLETGLPAALRLAARLARLHDGLLAWTGAGVLAAAPDGAQVGELLAATAAQFGLTATCLAVPDARTALGARHAARCVELSFPLPSAAERARVWTERLDEAGLSLAAADVAGLAEAFQLDSAATRWAIDAAITAATWRDPAAPRVQRADLVRAGQRQLAQALPNCAIRVEPTYTWDDLVLPDDQLCQLRELCDRVLHRQMVLDTWGFGSRVAAAGGITALFAGPSGSGKTLAAQIVAATLGLSLYRVDIAHVVSKYIGETEKQLDQLFRAAHGAGAVLLFDEADALFGKRSEVRDAHDRYANVETSYLLQAIEQHDGLTLLATNLRHNLDDAFARRLSFCITFPFPDEPERRRLWEGCWPWETPLGPDLDLPFLARQFKLTGGNIRNVAVAAAFAAAADGGPVTMAHVVRGVRREYQKLGKACAESEFGPYFGLLAGGATAPVGAPGAVGTIAELAVQPGGRAA